MTLLGSVYSVVCRFQKALTSSYAIEYGIWRCTLYVQFKDIL